MKLSNATLNDVSNRIKKLIYENENTKSFIQIDETAYAEIVDLMMKACSAEFTLNNLQSDETEDKPEMLPDESKRVAFGENILLYGVPGSGKS